MGKVVGSVVIALFLTACGTMPGFPGYISESKSDFDGSTWLKVHPGHASGCCALGAAWNSKQPDLVQIEAVLHGEYAAIADTGGLEFNVDGRMLRLSSSGLPTQFEATRGAGSSVMRTSSKSFAIRREDFGALVKASSVKVRLNTTKGAVEGDLLRDAYGGSAIEGFRTFATKLPQ